MDVITKAKQLGEALLSSNEYKLFEEAREKTNQNEALRIKIDHYNVQKSLLDTESTNPEQDSMLIDSLEAQVKKLYDEINKDPDMKNYKKAQDDFNILIQAVNMTIASYLSTSNENEEESSDGCPSSGCSACKGCH